MARNAQYNLSKSQRGLSLIELMIAMVLALVLTAAVITVFANNRQVSSASLPPDASPIVAATLA